MGPKRYTAASADAPVERVAQVVPEVLDVLDADRQAHQSLGDGRRLGLPAPAALQRRLDPAQRRGVHPEAGLAAEQVGRHLALREHDADDAAEARVADLRQRGVLAESAYELLGVGLGTLDAQVQRAQAAQRQPRLEGARDRADQVAAALEHRPELVVAGDDRTHLHVGVAGEVLRRGVHDEVDAVLEGALEQGSGEGVVHHDVGAGLVGGSGDRRDVRDLERRVGGRLEPHERGVGAGGDHGLGVGDVDELGAQPPARLEVAELHDRAGVGVPRHDDLAVRADEVEHGRHRREAGGEGQAAATLERAERVLEGGPGRVAVAAVLHLAARDVGRGHGDRGVEGCVGRLLGAPGRHGDGAGPVLRVVSHGSKRRWIGSCR